MAFIVSLILPRDVLMFIMENKTTNNPSDEIIQFDGTIQVQVSGTFDGATVTMQISQDGLPFFSLTETEAILMAPDVVLFTILKGARYRLDVTGGGASLNISASVLR